MLKRPPTGTTGLMQADFHAAPYSSPATVGPLRTLKETKREVGFSPSEPFSSVLTANQIRDFSLSWQGQEMVQKAWLKDFFTYLISQGHWAQSSHQHQRSTTPGSRKKMPQEISRQTSLTLREDSQARASAPSPSPPLTRPAHGAWVRASI